MSVVVHSTGATHIFPGKPSENLVVGRKVFFCTEKVHQVLGARKEAVKFCSDIWEGTVYLQSMSG